VKKFVAFFFIALLGLGMVACTGETPECPTCQDPNVCETCETCVVPASYSYGIAYGVVHGYYVGVAEITIGKDDKVVSAKMEEYYLPYNIGQIHVVESGIDTNDLPADVVAVAGARGTNYYAKYVSVNGTLYTIEVTGEAGSQSFKYKNGSVDVTDWADANAKVYVDGLIAGNVFRANADGTKSAYPAGNASVRIGIAKSATAYWTNAATWPLGWGGNMKAMADAIVGTTLSVDADDLTVTDVSGKNYWTVGDLVTGATLSDFTDYYVLYQAAYANAKANR